MSIAGDWSGVETSSLVITMLIVAASLTYPLYIILFIFLSYRKNSLILALFALLPGIIIYFTLYWDDPVKEKQVYDSAPKEYICEDPNTFLAVDTFDFVNSYTKTKQLLFFDKYINKKMLHTFFEKWIEKLVLLI